MTRTTGGDLVVSFTGLAGSVASAFMFGTPWSLPTLAFSAGLLVGVTVKRILDDEPSRPEERA